MAQDDVQFLLLVLAGWVNRQQQDVIDYLQEENRVLLGLYRSCAPRQRIDGYQGLSEVLEHAEVAT